MKVTPLEIRQKSFEKVFRGYDKDEVDAYLLSLSQEWERLLDEYKESKLKLGSVEKEAEKLREVEGTLFKALKTAEDTGANLIDQANKTAELLLRETQMKADAILSDAKSRAKSIIEEAENTANHIIEEMEEDVRAIEQTYRMLENYRDALISDLKNLGNETLEKVERASNNRKRFSIDDHIDRMKTISKDASYKKTIPELKNNNVVEIQNVRKEPEPMQAKKTTSFFDELE